MTVVINQSLYPAQGFEHRFYHGNRYHCISAKVTLDWDEQGRLSSPRRQPDWVRNDEWLDEADRSSLIYPSEMIPFKPATDVLVVGTALSPEGRPLREWNAALCIKDQTKRLRLFGPREWRHSAMGGWRLSGPEACSGVALLYENAYGGTVGPAREHYAEGDYYPPNPFGSGYVGKQRPDTNAPLRAAQIEAWDGPITHFGQDVAVGGFGALPGFVPARAQYAGTTDADWEASVKPNIPPDMDMRYWNTAPADQQASEYLRPGDVIGLVNLRPGAPLRLAMPPIDPATLCEYDEDNRRAAAMNLDTVTIDLDAQRMTLRYHQILPFDESIKRINVHCAPYAALAGS
ncbi:hypothetical protein DFR29_1432 [Tahibacter aquaticus]|uniref:DUF2169 domain-containing protein n=1 Tax=Tahibacter aquaticus TaxID=520092 RepID=A0A4R6YF35_9GAMM|nr:DUF2169 domain-containing protein [Tahibacter aquaticus]TDR34784.1 hypothetical protein DFR29_1432 [Tahibacter aquaticus]